MHNAFTCVAALKKSDNTYTYTQIVRDVGGRMTELRAVSNGYGEDDAARGGRVRSLAAQILQRLY